MNLKRITINNILGILKFMVLIIPAFIYKKICKKNIWLISEHQTARDNGFFFYKYLKENHSEIKSYYAIDFKNSDYSNLKEFDGLIKWESLKHYFIYMASEKIIVSHKNGNPNHPLFTFLQKYFNKYNNVIFLQHGVLYQNLEMFHKDKAKFKLFICGAKPEYEFVKEKYGYNKNEVVYTGLARFDGLHNKEHDSSIILYMPTWRRWLGKRENLEKSEYFQRIKEVLQDSNLNRILENYDKYLYFCPHIGLYNCRELFKSDSDRIKIVDLDKSNIQELLIKGALLITDFSSLHTDFAYMHKPIIYYQYDKEEFLSKHIGKCAADTYFDYERDGFGKVVDNKEELIENIEKNILDNFIVDNQYINRVEGFFQLYDNNNCERIFNEIMNL